MRKQGSQIRTEINCSNIMNLIRIKLIRGHMKRYIESSLSRTKSGKVTPTLNEIFARI
jgi:hypothetical protein